MTSASAAGKVILLGEHAVVYGRPAIAVPVSDIRATVEISEAEPGSGIQIVAQDLGLILILGDPCEQEAAEPLQVTVSNTLQQLGIGITGPALRIVVRSEVPIARGMGSGTAVATALVRALAQHYERHLTARAISDLVYQTEIILHGTPSGIDNSVVAFEKPVYFIKGQRADVFGVGRPFTLLIADTGMPSRTRDTVGAVRARWQADPARYEALFDAIGALAQEGQRAIAEGELALLGELMDRNHQLLAALGVSNPALDGLVAVAQNAGALGAKLSGGGGGGCMIALVDEAHHAPVAEALQRAGAARVMATTVH